MSARLATWPKVGTKAYRSGSSDILLWEGHVGNVAYIILQGKASKIEI